MQLYQVREQREHPLRDDKLIVSWCAQMATTLVWASQTLPFTEAAGWLTSAETAVQRMLDDNLQAGGELKRISLHGVVSITGQLEDYSNLIQALICLYDVTDKPDYLSKACALTARVIEEFWDSMSKDSVLRLASRRVRSWSDRPMPRTARRCRQSR